MSRLAEANSAISNIKCTFISLLFLAIVLYPLREICLSSKNLMQQILLPFSALLGPFFSLLLTMALCGIKDIHEKFANLGTEICWTTLSSTSCKFEGVSFSPKGRPLQGILDKCSKITDICVVIIEK